MDSLDEKMGYVIARLEEMKEESVKAQQKLDALQERVDDKFKAVETTFLTVKWIGVAVFTVLTLPLSQIKTFVLRLFS